MRIIAACAFAATVTTPVSAGELIVSREPNGMAVFLRVGLTEVAPLFGHEPSVFFTATGAVDLDKISLGTFEGADVLSQDVRFSVGPSAAAFEAMSMMVHPDTNTLPFSDPIEAQIAIAVCGVDWPDRVLLPHEFEWVGGWYAYPVDSGKDLSITFPHTGRAPMDLTVLVFDDGEVSDRFDVTVQDGGTVHVEDARPWFQRLFAKS